VTRIYCRAMLILASSLALVLSPLVPVGYAAEFGTWGYKMKITFDGYEGTSDLTNFPVLVTFSNNTNGSGFEYNQVSDPNGWDLRFSDSDEFTELAYEIDE